MGFFLTKFQHSGKITTLLTNRKLTMNKQLSKEITLINVKINSMTSLEIAELTGKQHKNVLRDIKNMVDDLIDGSNLSHEQYQGVTLSIDERGYTSLATMDKSHTLTLATGYSVKLRKLIIDRWQYLEDQLAILKDKSASRKAQLEAMEALHDLLPPIEQGEALNYIKANTVVNKAVSNYYGFPKMLKKDQMNADMIATRDKVLKNYISLYDVYEDNALVAEAIYRKWSQPLIENKPE